MPSEFVPFLKSHGANAPVSAQKKVSAASLSSHDNAAAAVAFAALVPGNAPAQIGSPNACAKAPADSKPVVTLKRNGDHVTHIHIQCGCGEVIELECQ